MSNRGILVIYQSEDETLVTSLENEDAMLEEYLFGLPHGRKRDSYVRSITSGTVEVSSKTQVRKSYFPTNPYASDTPAIVHEDMILPTSDDVWNW